MTSEYGTGFCFFISRDFCSTHKQVVTQYCLHSRLSRCSGGRIAMECQHARTNAIVQVQTRVDVYFSLCNFHGDGIRLERTASEHRMGFVTCEAVLRSKPLNSLTWAEKPRFTLAASRENTLQNTPTAPHLSNVVSIALGLHCIVHE